MARLGDVCTVVSGTTPNTNNPKFWDGDINWITPAELDESTVVISESKRKITIEGVQSCGLSPFPAGTVILSSRAPIGKTAIAGTEMYCNQGFKNLICTDRIYNKYLFWFLRCKTQYLNSLGRGATFKEISKAIVEQIEIPLPDLPTQRRIAATLDKVSKGIDLCRKMLGDLDALVKAQFVEMFGDCIVNDLKWVVKPLCDVLVAGRTVTYGIVQTEEDVPDGVPVFRPVDISQGHIPTRNELKRTKKEISDRYKRTLLSGNELLITVRGSVGETFQTSAEFAGCNVARNIVPLESNPQILDQAFLKAVLDSTAFQRKLAELTKGAALKGINMNEFKLCPIILPALELQKQYVSFVAQADKSKFAIQQQLAELETLKKSLMQEYFGKGENI